MDHVAPEFIARELFETAVNMRGDADADLYLARVVSQVQTFWANERG